MRNFFAFFQKFKIFLVFIFLQILALTSYLSILNYPRTKYLNSSSSVYASMLSINHKVTKHFNLETENLVLQRALKRAQTENIDNYIPVSSSKIKIEDTVYQIQYKFIPATVINGTYSRKDNFFTLNQGRLAGIKKDMGVVSADGLVGIVYDVSNHYAVVKSVLHSSINIPVKVEGPNARGLLKWEMDGKDPLRIKLTGISNDIPIPRASRVVTTGSSTIFPPGYSVGKVEITKTIEGKPEWDVIVRLSNDLRTVENVFVIENLMKLEQQDLENIAKEEFKVE